METTQLIGFENLLSQYFEVSLTFAMLFLPTLLNKVIPQLEQYNKAITSILVMLALGVMFIYGFGGTWKEVYTSIILAVFKYNIWGKRALEPIIKSQ